MVWPLPLSLATTHGISVDFSSSGYLDDSDPRVPSVHLFYSLHAVRLFTVRVPPFGNPRIDGYLHLPAAYRSLSRPSSAPDAKAFPLCSSSLELLFRFSCLNCCNHISQLLFGKIVPNFTERPDSSSFVFLFHFTCSCSFLYSVFNELSHFFAGSRQRPCVSALTYLPGQSPAKYCRHCAA